MTDKLNQTPYDLKLLNAGPSTSIGGVDATFYQDQEDGSVYVLLNDEGFWVVGLLPESYAEKARSIDCDPYDSTPYVRNSVYLACSALKNAIYHQSGKQKKAKQGGCVYEVTFASYLEDYE